MLFLIELAFRRGFLAGCTEQPPAAWVTQQARNLSWGLGQAILVRGSDRATCGGSS